jgi:predicted acyl esterase
MRKNIKTKSLQKIIDKYAESVEIIDKTATLDKESGRFVNERTKKVLSMAIFKKKNKFVLGVDKIEKTSDIKIYSNFFLKDELELLKFNKLYRLIDVEERVEASPIIYIAYAEEIESE